jgi:hypothetical protein
MATTTTIHVGADEYDAYISWSRRGYEVSFEGKHVGTFETERRARAAVSVEMRRSGYFPNVYVVSDHGNLHRIEVW